MPELPEVETVRTAMEMNIGARVERIDVLRLDIIRQRDFEPEQLYGEKLGQIDRRGKYLVLQFENRGLIVVHMGMSGRFYMMEEEADVLESHVHFILHLDNHCKLVYRDARRFGGIWFSMDTEKLFAHMGVEPLSQEFTADYLAQVISNRKVSIKTLLLNQTLISGLGNIYADEALFESRIKPNRPAGSLTIHETQRLHAAIQKVLRNSIDRRGTTFRDYRDGFNLAGENQNYLNVYGRTGLSCPVCGCEISKEKIGGRSSHFCPQCQQ